MAETPVIGVRFPPELSEQIEALIGKAGKNKSEVVLTLVKRGLGIEPSPDAQTILARLDDLEKKLPPCQMLNNG